LVAPVVESIRELNDKVENLVSQNRYLVDENKKNNNEIELLKEKITNVEKYQKQADSYLFLLSVMLFVFIVFVCRKNNK
jgi:predicted nuclease with TOPRIM domain